jgi:hypothetical protein
MYICIFVYVYVFTNTHIHIDIFIYIYSCIYIYIYTYMLTDVRISDADIPDVRIPYCERWEDMVDDVSRLFEWAVANRLNKIEWLLLGTYVLVGLFCYICSFLLFVWLFFLTDALLAVVYVSNVEANRLNKIEWLLLGTNMYIHICAHPSINIHMHIHIYAYIYTSINSYKHVHISPDSLFTSYTTFH